MSEIEVIAKNLIESMLQIKKITELESKMLLRFLMQEDIQKRINLGGNESEITQELLNIINEVSVKVSIPPHNMQDDLSSPLDTFLLAKKKDSDRHPQISEGKIANLIKIE